MEKVRKLSKYIAQLALLQKMPAPLAADRDPTPQAFGFGLPLAVLSGVELHSSCQGRHRDEIEIDPHPRNLAGISIDVTSKPEIARSVEIPLANHVRACVKSLDEI